MIRFHYQRKFIFSLIVLLIGCEGTNTNIPSDEITSLTFKNGTSQTHSITINNENVGTNNVTITTGIQRTIENNSYSKIIEYKETIEFLGSSGVNNTYFKDYNDEYIFFSWNNGPTATNFLRLPLKYGEQLFGSFGIMNTDTMFITIIDQHDTFISKNNNTFNNVFEAQNENGSIRVFLNETYFIIQKEDYRYSPTIQSLIIND